MDFFRKKTSPLFTIKELLSAIKNRHKKKIDDMHRHRILFITAYDQNIKNIGEISAATVACYCQVYGYSHVVVELPTAFQERSAVWNKMILVKKHIDEYDYVVWVDADAFILNYSYDIQDLIKPDKELYICHDHLGINMGVFMVKCSDFSKALMTEIYNQSQFVGVGWEEQSALTYCYTQNWCQLQHKTCFIDQDLLNAYLHRFYNNKAENKGEFVPGTSLILHLPSMRNSLRLKIVEMWMIPYLKTLLN